jgi:putative transposase
VKNADGAFVSPWGVMLDFPDLARPLGQFIDNGYRGREWDTRAGTIELAIPKLREGSYFPGWLLERQRRAESALISVVAACYLLGVSTRRMDRLVHTLGITSLSKSQVLQLAKELDVQVEAFRTRPLDARPYTFLAAGALALKVGEGARTVNVHALLAVGVNGALRSTIVVFPQICRCPESVR